MSGGVYLVTAVTLGRHAAFTDFALARKTIRRMHEAGARGLADTLAYVLMPDHLHWLLRLGNGQDLSRVVGGFKSVAAREAGGCLWQQGFHDHAVRQEEDLVRLARYLVANPLRAGLVQHAGDWPHWDSVWL